MFTIKAYRHCDGHEYDSYCCANYRVRKLLSTDSEVETDGVVPGDRVLEIENPSSESSHWLFLTGKPGKGYYKSAFVSNPAGNTVDHIQPGRPID